MKCSHEITVCLELWEDEAEREYTVSFEFSAYYDPGRTGGPPEDCYPPEGEHEWEINKITSEDDTVCSLDSFSEAHQEQIEKEVEAWVEENGVEECEEAAADEKCEAQISAMEDRMNDPYDYY